MDYIWIIFLFLLSIVMLVKPELLWKIEHLFSVKNGEPTDLYLAFMRIGGIFFLVTSMIVLLTSVL